MSRDNDGHGGFALTPRAVFGLCVIAFGVLLTAANLGWIDFYRAWSLWPLAIIAFGLSIASNSSGTSGQVFGGLMVVAGIWLMAEMFLNIRFHIEDWWPLLLIGLGIVFLTRGPRRSASKASSLGADGLPIRMNVTDTSARSSLPPGDDWIHAFAFWSGAVRKVTSQAFRGADLTAVMGGVQLDLRQASTATGEAEVDVFAVWGGIDIRVPPDWMVVDKSMAIMGGVEDKTQGTQTPRHRLIVRGTVIMGGIAIKS